ncbi:MAG: hypothetical protein VX916_03210 [Planctomycetota bacterium]|nr:hypothetical protein [Planctomycetota bacterium]
MERKSPYTWRRILPAVLLFSFSESATTQEDTLLGRDHILWESSAEISEEQSGLIVAGVGDLDADGFGDIAVGMPGHDGRGDDAGAVLVISGRTGDTLHLLFGRRARDRFGHAVAGAGDVNQDGFDDLIVGAPGVENDKGAAYVFSGKKGDERFRVEGEQGGGQLGWSVSSAGDVNFDGSFDVIIGSPGFDGEAGENCGQAQVISGMTRRKIERLHLWQGMAEGEEFGWSVAGSQYPYRRPSDGECGDDAMPNTAPYDHGERQIMVGAPGGRADPHGPRVGLVHIYKGREGTLVKTLMGRSRDDRFGNQVTGCGDMNGDSWLDVAVGTDSENGYIRVFSCRDGRMLRHFRSPLKHVRFGYSIGGFLDIDQDGFDDLVVGMPGDRQALASGETTGMPAVLVFSGRLGKAVFTLPAENPEEHFGCSVASAGDFNGDGFADVIVGADRFEVQPGFARVYSPRSP